MVEERGPSEPTGEPTAEPTGGLSGERWDATQRAALAAAATDPAVVVLGAPGTGKSVLAVEIVTRAVEEGGLDPSQVLVLAPGRRTAARLRARLERRWGRTVTAPVVRSVAAAAFAVVAQDCRLRGTPPPSLATGPQQDAVLAALLAGHEAGEGAAVAWPELVGPETRALRGFRAELRDLLMRCAERGLAPSELAALGREHGRPEWAAAAQVYQEYLDVTLLSRTTPDLGPQLDAARIVDEAAATVRAWTQDGEPEHRRLRLVVVDDYQEATAATAALLDALAADGARLVVLGDPDTAVQGFRGARPGLLGRAEAPAGGGVGERGASRVVLGTAWRQGEALRRVTREVTGHVSVVSGAAHRSAAAVPEVTVAAPDDGGTSAVVQAAATWHVLRSAGQEHAFVARVLREEHLRGGTPWGQMVAIARSNTQVAGLRRALSAAGVPVRSVGLSAPLRDEPAARALLVALRSAAGDGLDEDTATDLLLSPYGGLDTLALRRLRRALLREARRGAEAAARDAEPDVAPVPGSGELLVELLLTPGTCAGVPEDLLAGVRRAAAVLAAARQAVTDRQDAYRGLWSLWEAAGVSDTWRRVALQEGAAAQRADHDLDVVLALLRDAEFASEREAGTTAAQLAERLLAQDIAADSLGAHGTAGDAVAVLSVAEAAGGEWDVAVVAGVQDGSWPDLRLRDSLLGAQALADLVDGRGDAHDLASQRRAVLDDELRMFAVAVSRARRRLVVTAVDDDESEPSAFCGLVDPQGPTAVSREELVPLDLRGLVTRARSRLVHAVEAPSTASAAGGSRAADRRPAADRDAGPATDRWARLLAWLAAQGVREADPGSWWGVAPPSTMEPLAEGGKPVAVSPSKVAGVHACSLRWALESAGGSQAQNVAAGLGTLVHEIASQHPSDGPDVLARVLDERWDELGLRPGWPTVRLRASADAMVRRLGAFQERRRPPVAVEKGFDLAVGRARVRGSIDRVDLPDDAASARGTAAVLVTDYKTGASPLSVREAAVDPQLATYQLAVEHGALEDAADENGTEERAVGDCGVVADHRRTTEVLGARLVYVGGTTKAAAIREQGGLRSFADPGWAVEMVEQAAEIMGASQFWATTNPGCRTCPVRRSCPVQPEGRTVVAARAATSVRTPAPVSDFSTVEAREARAWGAGARPDDDHGGAA